MSLVARFRWFFVLCLSLAFVSTAQAEVKVAVVDFQRALSEVDEGVTAMAKLEGMREEKMKRMEQMRRNLASKVEEYQKQSALLSDAARAEKENELGQAQMELQQLAASSEQELQTSYMGMVDELVQKMRGIAETMGQERGYNLVLETSQGAVVFSAGVPDITDELIKRYNTTHAIK